MKNIRNLLLLLGLIFIAAGPVYADMPSRGDMNGDGKVDVADAIIALQVLSQLPTSNLYPDNDVNKDGKIDMAEAIYVLQESAGLRLLPASGTVVLPDGFALAPATLTVSSAIGDVAVGIDRGFTVMEPAGGGTATVMLMDANGNVVMLGHVDTDNPSFNEISATSTAVEILFLATGAFTLPQTAWPDAYRTLVAAPETATLAGVISARMAASPTAVGDMDPVIVNAIDSAVASLLSGLYAQGPLGAESQSGGALAAIAPTQRTSAGAVGTGDLAVKRTALDAPNPGSGDLAVKMTPSEYTPRPGWGLIAAPSDDHRGIVITNQSRINRFYFVYRTGYIPSDGMTTDKPEPIEPWELVASGLIPSVTGTGGGFIGTIADFFSGTHTWDPENTPTIPLPLDPTDDALANTFRVYVVGLGWETLNADADLIRYGDAELVKSTLDDMCMYQAVKEILWPLLTKVIPCSERTDIWKDKSKVVAAINNFVKQAGSVGLAWQSQILSDKADVWKAAKALLKGAVGGALGQKQVRDALYGLVINITGTGYFSPATNGNIIEFADKLNGYIKGADAVLALGDIGSIGCQVANSNEYNIWDVFAAVPALRSVRQKPRSRLPSKPPLSQSNRPAIFLLPLPTYGAPRPMAHSKPVAALAVIPRTVSAARLRPTPWLIKPPSPEFRATHSRSMCWIRTGSRSAFLQEL